MQTVFGIQVLAWMLLWLSAMAWIKIRFPNSSAGKVLATIS